MWRSTKTKQNAVIIAGWLRGGVMEFQNVDLARASFCRWGPVSWRLRGRCPSTASFWWVVRSHAESRFCDSPLCPFLLRLSGMNRVLGRVGVMSKTQNSFYSEVLSLSLSWWGGHFLFNVLQYIAGRELRHCLCLQGKQFNEEFSQKASRE